MFLEVVFVRLGGAGALPDTVVCIVSFGTGVSGGDMSCSARDPRCPYRPVLSEPKREYSALGLMNAANAYCHLYVFI